MATMASRLRTSFTRLDKTYMADFREETDLCRTDRKGGRGDGLSLLGWDAGTREGDLDARFAAFSASNLAFDFRVRSGD